MTLMAKSRMHAELIKKATSKARGFSIDADAEITQPVTPPPFTKQQTPPLPPLPAPPAPAPPPPPPPPPSNPTLSADISDGISHMTSMSKSEMHKELISKAQSKKIPITTTLEPEHGKKVPEPDKNVPESDKKVQERKRIVQELLKKEESCSSIRKLNEQRRMEFFSQEGTANLIPENEATEIQKPPQALANEKESVKIQISENNKIIIEEKINQEQKTPEISSKKSCTIL
eukprot:GFUD01123658.1.p1 GENE.GFUD01123658.1~~GFUD01123658.1.p1  ORF type:complete len:231 (-),score=78.13 GFUD01123658.1:134-826(-)